MTRGTIVVDRKRAVGVRAGGVGLALTLAWVAALSLWPEPEHDTAPKASLQVSPPTSIAMPVHAVATAAPVPPALHTLPSKATAKAVAPPAERLSGFPYRLIGKLGSGPEAAVVLFGGGRIVTVRGPGRLDDEHDVEAVFEEYLVVRHRPTGAGTLLDLSDRRPVAARPADPEDSARD